MWWNTAKEAYHLFCAFANWKRFHVLFLNHYITSVLLSGCFCLHFRIYCPPQNFQINWRKFVPFYWRWREKKPKAMDGFGKFQEHEKLEFLLTFTSCSCYLFHTAYSVILYNYFTECCRAIQEEWGRAGFGLFRPSLSRLGSCGFSKRMRIPVPARVTVERWLCFVAGWWAAFCETEADSRDGGPLQLDQKSSCESRRCQTNGRHVSAACRYGTNSIFQGFQ